MAGLSIDDLLEGVNLPSATKEEYRTLMSAVNSIGSDKSSLRTQKTKPTEPQENDTTSVVTGRSPFAPPLKDGTSTVSDPDSFFNGIARALNQSQEDAFKGLEIMGRKSGISTLEKYGKEQSQIQALEKAEYGQPTRSASITGGYDEIKKAYEEQGIGAAFDRGALLVKDMAASALGSMALPVGAAIAAPVAASALGAGGVGAGIFGIAATLLTAYPMAVGGIEEEAKKIGATQEKADNAALLGGVVVAAAERFGAASLVKQLVKAIGPDAVLQEFEKAVGKTAAKSVMKNAIETTAETAGKALVAGGKEAGTEGIQEITQMAAAGVAADKGVMPYTPGETINRVIDAMALGAVGGTTVASMSSLVAAGVERDTMLKAQEQREIENNLQKNIGDTLDNITAGGFEGQTALGKKMPLLSELVGKSVEALSGLAKTDPIAAELVAALTNEPNLLSAMTGEHFTMLDDTLRSVKDNWKLPLSKSINTEVNNRLLSVLRDGVEDADPNINEVAKRLKTDFFGEVETDPETGTPLTIIKLTPKEISSSISANLPMRETQIPDMADLKLKSLVSDGKITQADAMRVMRDMEPLKKRFNEMVDGGMKVTDALSKIKNTKEFIELADRPVWKPKASGIFKQLIDNNIDVNFTQGYFTRVFKTDKKSQKALQSELTAIYGPTVAASITDNIMGNDGYYTPDPSSYINVEAPHSTRPFIGPASFQQPRSLPEAVIRRLEKAGAVETDIQKVASKYAVKASKQIVTKRLADKINASIPELRQKGLISLAEEKRIKDIYDALNHSYKPIANKTYQEAQKWLLTSQNVLLLPLTAITSLPEFLIALSRISPKYIPFAVMNASYNAMRRGLRKVIPKLPLRDQERAFQSIIEGLDNSIANRLGEIANVSSSKTVTDFFFKATLLDFVTRISRDVVFQASRNQMRDDLRLIREVNQTGKKTRGYVFAQRRLLEQGIVNPLDKTVQDWASGGLEKDPSIIRQAMAKTVNEIITSPNVINRPMWMSNPYLAPVAQLKGFMTVFANNVVGRMWREVFVPLTKGRIPVGEAMKYAVMFGLLSVANMFIMGLKDTIRYGDEESPNDKLSGPEKLWKGFMSSGITGLFGAVTDAANAAKYGSNFWASLLGPLAAQAGNIAEASSNYVLNDKPRQLARELSKLIPLFNIVPLAVDWKQNLVDSIEENLSNARKAVVN
jgi:hypothetical protein